MDFEFDQHIGVFKNAFSKEWCEDVISSTKNHTQNFKQNTQIRKSYDYYNDTSVSFFDVNTKLGEDFCLKFWEDYFSVYIDKCKLSPRFVEDLYISDLKFQSTAPTEGYHLWHYEQGPQNPFRWGVYTLYLNDIEEGGETEFLLQQTRIKPTRGTLCIFPSGYTHIHRGNPPLNHTKYILTGWLDYFYNTTNPDTPHPFINHNIHFNKQHIRGRFN